MGNMNGDNESSSKGSKNYARPPMPVSQKIHDDERNMQARPTPGRSSADLGPLHSIPEFQENDSENYSSYNRNKSLGKLGIQKRFKEDGRTESMGSGSLDDKHCFQHGHAGDGRSKFHAKKKEPVLMRSQMEQLGVDIPGRKLDDNGGSDRSNGDSPEIQGIKRQFHATGHVQNPGMSKHQRQQGSM